MFENMYHGMVLTYKHTRVIFTTGPSLLSDGIVPQRFVQEYVVYYSLHVPTVLSEPPACWLVVTDLCAYLLSKSRVSDQNGVSQA